jgi:acyl-CoA synthetase (AMP-forming)/AMP-acid ligase II
MGDGHRTVTADQLLDTATGFAALLREHGVGEGDCVAVWLPSWSDSYAWQFAASAVGAHVIGVNTRYNITEVGHVLHKARPKVLVMAHAFQRIDFLSTLRGAIAEASARSADAFAAPFVIATAVPGAEQDFDAADYDQGAGSCRSTDVPAGASAADFRLQGDPRTLAVAFTTSGSTGLPKLAAHDEFAVVHHSEQVAERIGCEPEDIMVEPLPYSGVFGYVAGMAALFGGAAVMLQAVFNETRLLHAWHQFRGTHFVGADDMLSRLRAAWEAEPLDLSSWRWTGIADFQGMSKEIASWSAREFGTATGGVYGSSEIFALTSFWTQDRPEDLRWSGGGTLTSPEYTYRIADPVTDAEVPAGERGEIQFRGPNVVSAYLGDEGEGAKAFTADGWFRSGDLGEAIDDRSYLYVCRIGDVLRLKGFLVDPAEIEIHLAGHPDVEIAKVVGRAGDSGEPEAVAFVSLTDSGTATPEDLREYCKASLARFKVPAEVRIIEDMPTVAGTNGAKIRAVTLREWAARPASDAPGVAASQ